MKSESNSQDKIVFRAFIQHPNNSINIFQNQIGENSVSKLSELAGEFKHEFDEHMNLCDEVEGVLKHLVNCGMPVATGTTLSIRNGSKVYCISDISYKYLHEKKAILSQFFLYKVF